MCTKGNCKTGNCKTDKCKTTLKEQVDKLSNVLSCTIEELNGTSIVLVSLIAMMIDDGTIDENKLNSFIENTYKKFR